MADRQAPRAAYWADRFALAAADPDEARALLTLFAELADDAVGADPALIQWVAQRVKAWVEAGFVRDEAPRAFATTKAAHAPRNARAAEKRAKAVAEVLRLNRIDGLPLNEAFERGGELVGLSASQVENEYTAFRKSGPAAADVREWLPVLLRLPKAHRSVAMSKGKVGRPAKKKPTP